MPFIEYRGFTDVVNVPAHNIAEAKRGVPIEVPDHVADDLTLQGTSSTWVAVDPPADDQDDEGQEG